MKKTGIVLFCMIIGFTLGCKKKAAEPEITPAVAVADTASSEVGTPANTEPAPADVTVAAQTDYLVWMTDFVAAQKQAAAEGKDLFINFTGSDWCGWCKRLDKEVFSQKIFIHEAQKHFIFVKVDFPRNTKLSDTLQAQNEKLAQRYEARAFPTIILAEANGRPYGQTGYLEDGPLVYLQELAKLQLQKPKK
jgi:thioredoxin-related protein